MVWYRINGLFNIYSEDNSNGPLMATNNAFSLRMHGKTFVYRRNHYGSSTYCFRLQIIIFQVDIGQ